MICEKLNGCPFFSNLLPVEKGLEPIFKKKYCEKDKTMCARYIVSTTVGEEHVPGNLYPNMTKVAEVILKSVNKLEPVDK